VALHWGSGIENWGDRRGCRGTAALETANREPASARLNARAFFGKILQFSLARGAGRHMNAGSTTRGDSWRGRQDETNRTPLNTRICLGSPSPLKQAAEPLVTVTLDGVAACKKMFTHPVICLVPAVFFEFDHFPQLVRPVPPSFAPPVGCALNF